MRRGFGLWAFGGAVLGDLRTQVGREKCAAVRAIENGLSWLGRCVPQRPSPGGLGTSQQIEGQ